MIFGGVRNSVKCSLLSIKINKSLKRLNSKKTQKKYEQINKIKYNTYRTQINIARFTTFAAIYNCGSNSLSV